MAAGAEPLVEWINGARGVGKTAAAWAERGEVEHGEARHGEAEFPEPERGEEA